MWPFDVKERMQKEHDNKTREINDVYKRDNSKPFNEFTRHDITLFNAENFMIYMNDEIKQLKAELEELRGKG